MRACFFIPTPAVPIFAALTLALPAAAQQPVQPPQTAAMQQCMDMMGGPSAALLLEHGERLSLTADQVSRLEAIRARTQTPNVHMQPIREAHMRAAALLRADSPDLDEYEDALEEAAEHMVEAHVAMVRDNLEARQVLTAEQRTQLGTLGPMHPMPARADTTRMPPRPGARMQRGENMQNMHGMMMMHCMMMGEASN